MRTRCDRLREIGSIGVERLGALADAQADPELLRLENLDTDIRPWPAALEETHRSIDADAANSYLPFVGQEALRRSATAHVSRMSGVQYDWRRSCVISAGGLNGILNVLLATLDPGDQVVLTDPVYAGLLNRVRLAGGRPRLAKLIPHVSKGWRADLDEFRTAVRSSRVRAVLMMSPSMPTGCVLTADEWKQIADACVQSDVLLIYDAAMERILFDEREVIHPASLPGMAERTVTVGSASKELRMIGWRVGWIVGPEWLMPDVALVSLANVVSQVGIGMSGVTTAMEAPASDLTKAVVEWQKRRDVVLSELDGLIPAIPSHGGWSLLVDAGALGMSAKELSERLLLRAKIAATPMEGWGGPNTSRYLRLVYANESCERLSTVRQRAKRALD
jgi:N-succinyldiaminopimelate aminotransferase